MWLVPPLFALLLAVMPRLVDAEEVPRSLDEYTTAVSERVPAILDRDGVPGASVAVVADGELVWAEGFGVRDRETGEPVAADTVFQAGSNAKSLTAWAVLRMAEQGRLKLDVPVDEQVAGWQLPTGEYPANEVTLERLLAHTAGLPFAITGVPRSVGELRRWEVDSSGFEVRHEPEAGFVYSNPGYAVLGLLVEEAAGEPFAEVMAREVLEPLSMHDSTFALDDQLGGRAATGYDQDGKPVPVDWRAPLAASGLHTTAPDLARFAAAAHHGGAATPAGRGVLHPTTVEQLHQPRVSTAGIPHALMADYAAFGHFVEQLPRGHWVVAHGGEEEGWISGFVMVPATGDGLVVLTNSRAGYPLLIEQLADWSEWRGYGSLQLTRTYEWLVTGALAAIGLFAGIGSVVVWTLVRDTRAGARPTAPWAAGRPGRALGLLAGGVTLLVAWWALAADLLAGFLPYLTTWLASAITACALLLIARAFLEPAKHAVDHER
jgi:CubicO group peptidase (beta-lactamase class C family)